MQRAAARFLLCASLLAGLALIACGSDDSESAACLAGMSAYVAFNFYFGLERGDGTEVSAEEWAAFLADEVTPAFPDGLTVFAARGQWLDTEADRLYRERTNVLNVLVPAEGAAAAKQSLDTIADAYVEAFDQQVVFKTSHESCAGF